MRQFRTGLYALSDARYPGLRTRHYRLLTFIPDDGIRLTRVAETSGLTKQALAQALAPLQAGGHPGALPHPADRRGAIVWAPPPRPRADGTRLRGCPPDT